MIEKIYIRGTEVAKADDLLNKQETLISGNNIKTINGTSILGSGDITISGDGSSVDLSNYITKDNTAEYTPTEDYNPATKLYVDETVSNGISNIDENVYRITLTTGILGNTASGSSSLNSTDRQAYADWLTWYQARLGQPTVLEFYYNYNNNNTAGSGKTPHLLGRLEFPGNALEANLDISVSGIVPIRAVGSSLTTITGQVGQATCEICVVDIYFRTDIDDNGNYVPHDSFKGTYSSSRYVFGSDGYQREMVDGYTWLNTRTYTPTADYNAATKLYVDTEIQNSATTLQTNINTVQSNLDNRLPKLVALHSFSHETSDVQFTNYPLTATPFVTSSYVDNVNVTLGGMSEGDPDMWSIQEAGYYRVTVSMNVELGEGASLTMFIDRDWKQTPIVDEITAESYGWTCTGGSNNFTAILYLEAGSITTCAMNGEGAVKFAGMVEMTRIK